MDWELALIIALIMLNIVITMRSIQVLSNYMTELFQEMVEDLPPALGESISSAVQVGNMEDVNPIQLAIAQVIPNLFQAPQIDAKVLPRDESGKFA